MAKGSNAGWHGLPREKRFCLHCGVKLTLKTPGGQWRYEGPGEPYAAHHDCEIQARQESRAGG